MKRFKFTYIDSGGIERGRITTADSIQQALIRATDFMVSEPHEITSIAIMVEGGEN